MLCEPAAITNKNAMETEKTQFDKQISALVQEPDHLKMLCAVQDYIGGIDVVHAPDCLLAAEGMNILFAAGKYGKPSHITGVEIVFGRREWVNGKLMSELRKLNYYRK